MSSNNALQLEVVETTPALTDVSRPKDNSLVEMLGFENVTEIATLPKEEIREMISQIENFIKENGELIDIEVKHYFSKGVYAREMPMKKGELVVGKIHKHENFNILSKGKVSVLSIDGIKIVEAPYAFVGSAGTKRVIYAHEDSVWTVMHGTDEKDVAKIELEFIATDYDEISFQEAKCLGQQ